MAVNPLGFVAATGATYTTSAGGTVNSSVATVMYTQAGALDRHFGGRGIVTTNLSQPGVANQIEFNANGSLLIAGGTVASLSNIVASTSKSHSFNTPPPARWTRRSLRASR